MGLVTAPVPSIVSPRAGSAAGAVEARALGLRDGVDVARWLMHTSCRPTAAGAAGAVGSKAPYVLMEERGSPYDLEPARHVNRLAGFQPTGATLRPHGPNPLKRRCVRVR